MLRKFLILPIIVFLFIAFFQLSLRDYLYFALWFFVAAIMAFTLAPVIIKDVNDKHVPVMHIFITFALIILIGAVIVFADLIRSDFSSEMIAFFTIVGGLAITGIIMLIKGKEGKGSKPWT